jgi:PAS domain-containing protein
MHLPRVYHYLILGAMVIAIFLLDVWTPLGIAVWLLYVVPVGYAVRYVRRGRVTPAKVLLIISGVVVLMLLGWYLSSPGIDPGVALLNRLFGIATLSFVALFGAWLVNRNRSLREAEAVIRERLAEKELRLKQALETGGMAAIEWDLRKGTVQWAGSHESLTGRTASPFIETYHKYLERVHEEDRDTVREELNRAMREGSDYDLQYRVYAAGNQPRSVAARGRFIHRGMQPIRMVGVCLDLTDRDAAMEDPSGQMVIDLAEVACNTVSREVTWKALEWTQRVGRAGKERIRTIVRRPRKTA